MMRRTIRLAAALLAALLLLNCAALAEGQFPYRIAEKGEGAELLLSNSAYCEDLSQQNLDYSVQRKGAALEEWREFAAGQALDFTEAEKQVLRAAMAEIERVLDENAYALPGLDEIVFVRTTQREEGAIDESGSVAYTLGNQIYLGEYMLELLGSESAEMLRFGRYALCHEIFHCLTRNNPEFRRDMYSLIHFTVHEQEYEMPPELREIYFSNPDVGRHDASASFVINGEETECYLVCVVDAPFEQPGDDAFERLEIVLVPVDDPGAYVDYSEAENFWQVFGRNTDYVIDPEECMADNFGYALIYGETGPDGKPFPNPEILEAIREYLKA